MEVLYLLVCGAWRAFQSGCMQGSGYSKVLHVVDDTCEATVYQPCSYRHRASTNSIGQHSLQNAGQYVY